MATRDRPGSETSRGDPTSVVADVVARLRHAPAPLAAAVRGAPLVVAVAVVGDGPVGTTFAITREGGVVSPAGRGFEPDVEVRGTPAQVAEVLTGEISVAEAVLARLVRTRDTPRLDDFEAVVGVAREA